jgi:hypothetical protein
MPKHTLPAACDTPAAISPPKGTMAPNELQGMAVETLRRTSSTPWTTAASRCHTLLQHSIRLASQAQECCCRGRQQTHQLSVTTRKPGSTAMLFTPRGEIWAPTDADTGKTPGLSHPRCNPSGRQQVSPIRFWGCLCSGVGPVPVIT